MAIWRCAATAEIVVVWSSRTTQALHYNLVEISLILYVVCVARIDDLNLLHTTHIIAIFCPFNTPLFIPANHLDYHILLVALDLALAPRDKLLVGRLAKKSMMPAPLAVALLDTEDASWCAIGTYRRIP